MKILFIDNPSIQNSIRIGLLEQMAHHEVCLIGDFDEAIKFYNEKDPDMVIIDFTIEHGLEVLTKILKLNPAQHIITLSDSLDCSEFLGCDYCLEHYRKRRVLKHQGIHELLYLIDNFSAMPCEFANKLETPDTKQSSDTDED